jgi:hypothetical protein
MRKLCVDKITVAPSKNENCGSESPAAFHGSRFLRQLNNRGQLPAQCFDQAFFLFLGEFGQGIQRSEIAAHGRGG